MVLDMRPMLRGETDRITVDYLLSSDPTDLPEMSGPAHVTGSVTDQAGYMRLTLTATVAYAANCARCLDAVTGTFPVTLERTVAAKSTLSEKQLEENVDEYAVLENGTLDLDELMREEILLCFPTRFLCEPNCPGLCPKCGRSLKVGDCGCPKHEPDPRLAILGTLFDKDETEQTVIMHDPVQEEV